MIASAPAAPAASAEIQPKAITIDPALLSIQPAPAISTQPAAIRPPDAVPAGSASASAQLAPALIHIAREAGGQQITLRLAPAELGRVDIRIDRAADGTASIQVLVERPETLKLLQADQPQLQQTLDKAGLPTEGRSLSVTLAPPDTGGAGSFPGFGGTFADSQSGNARQQPRSSDRTGSAAKDTGGMPAATSAPAWRRAGINITA